MAVYEPHLRPQQILEARDVQRVAGGSHQALGAPHEANDGDGGIRQVAADVGRIVLAGLRVQQVAARDVSFTPPQRQQPAQAAHVGRCQVHRRVSAPQEAAHQVQRQVVAADGDDGVLHLLQRAQQFDFHLGASVHAFSMPGDPDHAVGAHQGHDHAGAALHWRRDHLISNSSHRNAQELIFANRGNHLAGHVGADATPRWHRRAQQPFQQWQQQQLSGQGRRHRVSRDSHHRLARRQTQRHRMAGPDGDAMHLQGPQ